MDNLGHPIPDAVHLPHPLHLVFCLELFCDAFGGCVLFRQQGKHLLGLPVALRQISGQLTGRLYYRAAGDNKTNYPTKKCSIAMNNSGLVFT